MNQALKYEELEKILFTKAPITDASIWLLKLDPDCQNNPVEKALLDANFKDGREVITAFDCPHSNEIYEAETYGVDWLAFREKPTLYDMMISAVPSIVIRNLIIYILSPYDDEIVPDDSLWDNVGLPVNFSPDTLRRAGVLDEAITCLYEFLFSAGEKMDLEDENLDGQITLERR